MLRVYDSVGDLFLQTISEHGSRPWFRWRNEVGQILEQTFQKVYEIASYIAAGLTTVGVKKGERVALCSESKPEWIQSDMAILGLGAVTVTVYPTLSAAQVQYIIEDSGSKVAFVDDKENLRKILEQWDKMPSLEQVFFFEHMSDKDLFDLAANEEKAQSSAFLIGDKVHSIEWLISQGIDIVNAQPKFFENTIRQVKENDLASLIYTSGTTGIPKGVMLTHRNFLSNAITASEIIKMVDPKMPPWEQNILSFMPLSHSFARAAEEMTTLYNAACFCFAGGRTPALIQTGFLVYKPVIMLGIPYVFEKVYNTIFDTVKKMPSFMQKLFHSGLIFGKKYNKILAEGKKPSLGMRLRHAIDAKLIYKRVQDQLGGRLLGFISGSARLSPEIQETFWALDVRIMEGFGLTETTPVTHVGRPIEVSDFRPNWPAGKLIHPIAKLGSVGPPLEFPSNPYPNVEAKIGPDGELLIRGPNVMAGYWNRPEETRETIEPDGWLHTGDIGSIDADGYLTITGRKKLIFKLSTGKMIAPALVEDSLTISPWILQMAVLGADQKYLTAFIVPNQKTVKEFADKKGIAYKNYQDLLTNVEVLQAIKNDILERSRNLSAFETIKKFAIFAQEFNEEEGYITPTLKIKRDRILKDFKDVEQALYATDKDWIVVDRRLVDFHKLTIPG